MTNIVPVVKRSSRRSVSAGLRLSVLSTACATLVLSACTLVCAAEPPDLIFHSGKVVTVDGQFRIAQAFAVRGSRIVAVGSDTEIVAQAGPGTSRIDLKGRFVCPGLIDSHVHATGAAVYEFDHPVPDFETVGQVLDYIRERTKVVPEGDWILLNQVFVTRLRDQRFPNRRELDEVAPKHPVAFRTGPDASLNSLALNLSGITKEFVITDGLPGRIERDEQGEPTGIVRSAGRFIKSKSNAKSPTGDEQRERLRQLLSDYNAVGITSIAERTGSESTIKLYSELRDRGELTCRAFLNWSVDPNGDFAKIRERVLAGANHPAHAYNEWVWLRGVKIFLDGGMLTGSAWMREPWGVSRIYSIDDPAYRGTVFVEPDRLYELAKLCLENNLQITAHAVGDAAVERLVDTYARIAENDFPVKAQRPCVTHCNFMSAAAIDKMARYGIVADLQPVWLYLDGATLVKQFGVERTRYFQPYHTLEAKGVVVGGGSDHMQKLGGLRSVNPYNPFLGMWTTLTRLPRWTETEFHPEEKIGREAMLRLYTRNNAFVLLDDANRGSIETGKLADFIVLDRDLLTCPADDVRTTTVLETWVGGKQVYRNQGQN